MPRIIPLSSPDPAPDAPRRRRSWWLPAALLMLLAIPLALAVMWLLTVLHAPVTSSSLGESLSVEARSAFGGGACTGDGRDLWRCRVGDRGGSGNVEYRVRVSPGTSCWRARLTDGSGGEGPMPPLADGCVHRVESWFDVLAGDA